MSLSGSLPVDAMNYRFAGPGGYLPAGTRVGSTDYATQHALLYAADGTTVLIGQKAMAASLPVAIASDQSPVAVAPAGGTPSGGSKSLTSTTTLQLSTSSVPCRAVMVQNPSSNAVAIVIGSSSAQPIVMQPGDTAVFAVSNVNLLYCGNVSSATQTVGWLSIN